MENAVPTTKKKLLLPLSQLCCTVLGRAKLVILNKMFFTEFCKTQPRYKSLSLHQIKCTKHLNIQGELSELEKILPGRAA